MTRPSLLTEADRTALLRNALAPERDHAPVVKLFTPQGAAIWLLSEMDPDEPDRLFGLCDLGLGFPELGYVSLRELEDLRELSGIAIERDHSFVADRVLSKYASDALIEGAINT